MLISCNLFLPAVINLCSHLAYSVHAAGLDPGLGQIPIPEHAGFPEQQSGLRFPDASDLASSNCTQDSDLLVQTTLFSVRGAVAPETSRVRQFLGIPFAEPPVNELRFRPPVTKKATNEVLDATKYGAYCMEHVPARSAIFSDYFPGHQYVAGQPESEDCLTLDIWAPREKLDPQADPKLKIPIGGNVVLIWIHGGALMTGDSSPPYTRGSKLVDAHQDVLLVSINYRHNIFGFPGASALDGRKLNPGFLDIRMAIKWVYHNIHYFNGNPNQMIIFGDSAGSSSVDKYIHAWGHDPIIKGAIMMSGQGELSSDPHDHSNFDYIATKLGCTGDKDEQFKCMQSVDAKDIAQVLNTYDSTANNGKVLIFQPQADNETSFSNYTDLQARGLYARVPQIIGNCNNEFASLITPFKEEGVDQLLLDKLSDAMFICPAAKAARARQEQGVPIWRYRYFGEWPNSNPVSWLGAYHGSDIAMVFGTADTYEPNTIEQTAISEYMQSIWVEFAKDPENALTGKFGWPKYVEDENTLVRLAYENKKQPSFVKGSMYDDGCGGPTIAWPIEL